MDSICRRTDRLRQIGRDIALLATEADAVPTECDELINFEYAVDERPADTFESSTDTQTCEGKSNASENDNFGSNFIDENFLQRKLDEMMSGTLEISWEDELKKDPIKPASLLRSLPETDHTEKDRMEIAAYEERMKQLAISRAAYVQKLISERKKLYSALEVQTRQFNSCVSNTLLSKIRTEFAIRSEELKLLMPSVEHARYRQIVENENTLKSQRQDIRNEIAELNKGHTLFETNLINLKVKFDELTAKDQLMDKQFRTTFSEFVSAGVLDQVYRIYKCVQSASINDTIKLI